jgi:integrin beta 3
LDVLIDGIKVDKLPFKDKWIIMNELGQELNMLLPDSQVELTAQYEFKSFSVSIFRLYGTIDHCSNLQTFQIKVPSIKYKSKLDGLCGNCDGNPKDDFKINPQRSTKVKTVKDPLKAFVLSWLAEEPTLQMNEQVCKVEDEEECLPLPPETDPCLKILDETLFGKCHLLVDPLMYVSACQQDLCRTGPTQKGACSSTAAYAKECNRNGICVDWRRDGFCSMEW